MCTVLAGPDVPQAWQSFYSVYFWLHWSFIVRGFSDGLWCEQGLLSAEVLGFHCGVSLVAEHGL